MSKNDMPENACKTCGGIGIVLPHFDEVTMCTSETCPDCRPDRRKEAVDHPAHYGGDTPHEVIKCLKAWNLESDALLWNAVKYIARAGKKGRRLEDLEKALWFLTRRVKELQEGTGFTDFTSRGDETIAQAQKRVQETLGVQKPLGGAL